MRYTKKETDHYVIAQELITKETTFYRGEPIELLGKLEDLLCALEEEQHLLSQNLDAYRQKGDTKSYRFRETMGQKMTNTLLQNKLVSYGLWNKEAEDAIE